MLLEFNVTLGLHFNEYDQKSWWWCRWFEHLSCMWKVGCSNQSCQKKILVVSETYSQIFHSQLNALQQGWMSWFLRDDHKNNLQLFTRNGGLTLWEKTFWEGCKTTSIRFRSKVRGSDSKTLDHLYIYKSLVCSDSHFMFCKIDQNRVLERMY